MKNKIKIWLECFRLRTLPVSLSGVIIAIGLAVWHGHFKWVPAVLCLVFAVLAQIVSNTANEYFDYLQGADKPGRVGPRRGVTEGDIKPTTLRNVTFGLLAILCPEAVMRLYTDKTSIQAVGVEYLRIVGFAYPLTVLSMAMASLLRCTDRVRVPLYGSIASVCTNICLNWVLIFGNLGAPAMGVRGAALATVISRYVELAIVVTHAHRNTDKYEFFRHAYRSGYVPPRLIGRIVRMGFPLLINEILWSLGMTLINQFYSTRGLNAVAALNITGTAWNLFCVIMFAMGSAVSIMVGQRLGAGELEEARDVDRKLIVLTEIIHILIGAAMIIAAPTVPKLYNVTPEVRDLTRRMLVIAGLSLPLHSFAHVTYFTIRSGGRTMITFLFDAVYTWAVTVTLAFCLTRLTDLPIVEIYFCVQFIDVIKLVIGLLMLRSDFWAQNVVKDM